MIKNNIVKEDNTLNLLLYKEVIKTISNEIAYPHCIVSRRKRTYIYYGNNQNLPIFMWITHRLLVKISLHQAVVKLEFNHRILTLDTIRYSTMIEMVKHSQVVHNSGDNIILYIPNIDSISILNELRYLVNSIRINDKNDRRSDKVNHHMNSLKSERVMSIKKEYESEICPTFSKPK